ncbi:glycosyltransferase family 2 protein [Chryseolinea lacunae]|uniref:Glycosyltransferase n=1 Tax=Chryseolinea lacunae TaxID=2801331 RepID=A0ABS1KS95_9BACT|nr:glycosyltransferase family 2 protein [Chryseolinea lacunae]MBL0742220.1 glycosyltransferase [Chryseolinea lacunae]
MEPKITIITAVYNGAKYIESTIASVIEHGGSCAYIIIDGGSTDGTQAIIQRYAAHLHFWVSEPDKGIYDAFNKGWNKANDDSFILFLGAGDTLLSLPQRESFEKADAIYGRVMMDDKSYFRATADFRLRLGNTLHHQALLIKKKLFPSSPFDLRFRTYADFDLNQRMLKAGVDFLFDSSFIAYALPGGVSAKFKVRESLAIVNKNFGPIYYVFSVLYYTLQFMKAKFAR